MQQGGVRIKLESKDSAAGIELVEVVGDQPQPPDPEKIIDEIKEAVEGVKTTKEVSAQGVKFENPHDATEIGLCTIVRRSVANIGRDAINSIQNVMDRYRISSFYLGAAVGSTITAPLVTALIVCLRNLCLPSSSPLSPLHAMAMTAAGASTASSVLCLACWLCSLNNDAEWCDDEEEAEAFRDVTGRALFLNSLFWSVILSFTPLDIFASLIGGAYLSQPDTEIVTTVSIGSTILLFTVVGCLLYSVVTGRFRPSAAETDTTPGDVVEVGSGTTPMMAHHSAVASQLPVASQQEPGDIPELDAKV